MVDPTGDHRLRTFLLYRLRDLSSVRKWKIFCTALDLSLLLSMPLYGLHKRFAIICRDIFRDVSHLRYDGIALTLHLDLPTRLSHDLLLLP